MKEKLRNRIAKLIENQNMSQLKNTIANLLGLEKYKGVYINYDRDMFVNNVDLYYIAEITDEGFIKNTSEGFSTLSLIKEHIDSQLNKN